MGRCPAPALGFPLSEHDGWALRRCLPHGAHRPRSRASRKSYAISPISVALTAWHAADQAFSSPFWPDRTGWRRNLNPAASPPFALGQYNRCATCLALLRSGRVNLPIPLATPPNVVRGHSLTRLAQRCRSNTGRRTALKRRGTTACPVRRRCARTTGREGRRLIPGALEIDPPALRPPRHAREGIPDLSLPRQRQVVDADLRRHDGDSTDESIISAGGIRLAPA